MQVFSFSDTNIFLRMLLKHAASCMQAVAERCRIPERRARVARRGDNLSEKLFDTRREFALHRSPGDAKNALYIHYSGTFAGLNASPGAA
jgi:hypothetical protein